MCTKLYDTRDDFNYPIVNFPFLCSNLTPLLHRSKSYFKANGTGIFETKRTSDGGNGNHSVSMPIILIKIKVYQMLHIHI